MEDIAVELGVHRGLQDVLEHAQLRFFLGLEGAGIVEHFTVAIAQDVGRVPSAKAQEARLERRREHSLHQRLTGLEIFAADGRFVLARQLEHHGQVNGEVRCAIRERNAFHQRGVCVHHRRRDHLVVLAQRLLERFHRLVRFCGFDIGFGRSAPHRDEAAGATRLPEFADVFAQLLGKIHLALALFHVGSVDLLHIVVIKDRGAWRHRRQERFQLIEQALIEHARVRSCVVHVVLEDVPSGEDQIIESSERDEFLHLRRTAVGALAEAHGAHLCE